jgi:hypothetical protein
MNNKEKGQLKRARGLLESSFDPDFRYYRGLVHFFPQDLVCECDKNPAELKIVPEGEKASRCEAGRKKLSLNILQRYCFSSSFL